MNIKTATNIQAILFDLDGTLISTLEVTEQVYSTHALQYNIDPQAIIDFCHGVPTLQVLQKFFPPTTHTKEYAETLELQAVNMLEGLRVIPGARQLVDSLVPGTWAIFTSGLPKLAVPRMRYLEIPVPGVLITPQDVSRGKPFPEGYCLAAERLGKDVDRCVVFEDAPAGIKAGVDAGALVIGVRTLLDHESLKHAGALFTVKDMTKVRVEYTGNEMTVFIDESD
ncbi:hypothetical protein J3B02_002480 [Coemansia erecta]|uniref:HAD-like protein n=1 Tax=Coemansia asiatica TaxID=1052880 RepID=A0A9W7XGI7_9FUNG|nr:hypothetical protein LPJ64_005707 [Coemansia asiatica]KAJ2854834.1 hypothetical protein J3B02_002480 [Coemansia erecta]KAJ2888172.1 hypothetical protein FB639_000817 [Coemansia asiatica]